MVGCLLTLVILYNINYNCFGSHSGNFHSENSMEDGYEYLSPIDAFGPQNSYNLHNMIGNAWEWVEDWWTYHHDLSETANPQGPQEGTEKVQKGGSFLCHHSYCYRYRVAARHKATPDSACLNTGFRCAKSLA